MIESKVKALSSGQHFLREKNFIAQGRIIPKWIVRFGPKSNSSGILCKFGEDPIQMKSLSFGQHFPHYKSMKAVIKALKGQVTPKSIFRSGRNSNSPEIVCLSKLSASLIKIQLKIKKAMLRPRTNMVFFSTQRQVTPKWIVRSGRNSEPEFYGDLVYKFKNKL